MTVAVLILLGLVVLAFLAAAVLDYHKLKKLFLEKGIKREKSQTFVDLLFHDHIKHEPDARKIQKRTIGLFCSCLIVVHVAMLFCGACQR